MRFGLAFAVALAPALGEADPLAAVEHAFSEWLEFHSGQGRIAFFEQGALSRRVDLGLPVDAPVDLASLSKAITGVCVSELVASGEMTWEDRFDVLYGSGPSVTIGQLLTHSGGLGPDGTQRAMALWFDTDESRMDDVLQLMNLRGGQTGVAGEFAYNNENYALLGLAIEAATAEPYAEACQRLALAPAGVSAAPSARAGGFLPWGGWSMTLENYGRFAWHWFGDGPPQTPTAPIGAFRYGPGMIYEMRLPGMRTWFWHDGLLCFPNRFAAGGLVVGSAEGVIVVLNHDICDLDASFGFFDVKLAIRNATP